MALKNHVDQYAKNFHLTEREGEVLFHLLNGIVSPQELGKKLNISLHTVNNHLKKILEKSNSDSKTELLADFLLFIEKKKDMSNPLTVRKKVLILDDESDLTKMLQNFFENRNIETYSFNDPLEALDSIRKLKIDVVISDIRMPKINGLSFLKEIRKLHFYEPGVIFISGYPEEFNMESLLDMGAFAFLEKPVDLEKLNRLVWEYVYGIRPMPDSESSVSICLGNIELNALELGFGGLFLDKAQLAQHPGIRLDVGGRVEIQFRLPESDSFYRAICEVIWKRSEGESKKPGYGLKFVEIEPHARRMVLDLVRTNNILSFIPRCSS
jgi:DNA-binding NarL/FixJ family response regulator